MDFTDIGLADGYETPYGTPENASALCAEQA
jgi:hypothetical protein